jgi:hypothetical protein
MTKKVLKNSQFLGWKQLSLIALVLGIELVVFAPYMLGKT